MIVIALIGGLILGAVFFGGLWLTIKKTFGTTKGTIWILLSSLFRTLIVVIGFYFLGQGNWQLLLIAVAGFIVSRFLVLRMTSRIDQRQNKQIETSNL